jgi:hypothetical protein
MKIKELIKQLQAIEKVHGDMEVYARGKKKHRTTNFPTVAYIKEYDDRCYQYPENLSEESAFNKKVVFIF